MDTIENTLAIGWVILGGLLLVYCVVRSVLGRTKAPLIEAGIGLLGGVSAGVAQFATARFAMRLVALASLVQGMALRPRAISTFLTVLQHLADPWGYDRFMLRFFPVFFGYGARDLPDSGLGIQILAVGFVSLSWFPFGVTLAGVVESLDRRWQVTQA